MAKASASKSGSDGVVDGNEVVPCDWRGLIGHEALVSAWRGLHAAGTLPPVLLLTGREGIGKTSLLAALSALSVCATGTACGTCAACVALRNGVHSEVLWLTGEKLLIAHAAALQDHLALSPAPPCAWRVALIPDADRLSAQAANRLLKTLEEPPPRARILLSTSRPRALLPTVLSRCVRWRVQPPPEAASRAWLAARITAAGKAVPAAGALDELLKRAGLAPGVALALAGLGEDGDDFQDPDFGPLIEARSPAEALSAAERLGRGAGKSVPELLASFDRELNRRYALQLEAPAMGPLDAGALMRRRDIIRQARRLARGGQVPLNAQLAVEALAFAGPHAGDSSAGH